MKPFNSEEAKKGAPVCTRNREDVRIICYDRKGSQPIVALIAKEDGSECLLSYCDDGSFYLGDAISIHDLFMKLVKREGWVNIYNYEVDTGSIFSTEKEARDKGEQVSGYVATARIEWEE